VSALCTLEGLTMGGTWRLRLPLSGRDGVQSRVQGLVQSTLDLVDNQMSAWKPGSDLNALNAAPLGQWLRLSPEIVTVIAAGLAMMEKTNGRFSICLGGASARHGFQPGRVCDIGTGAAIEVEADRCHVRRMADVAVDLNALAKGFAADLVALRLADDGHSDFLIEVAGDIYAQGCRPDGMPWTVALELPIPNRMIPARFLRLADATGGEGLCTSGGYRRHHDGKSHLISPQTGAALPADIGSIAVYAATAMQADALATALAVMGPQDGLAFAAEENLAAVWITPTEGGFQELGSPAMLRRLEAPLELTN
jgi:thiamine biosynthesis lipoprotein